MGVEVDDLKDAMQKISAEGAATIQRLVPKKSGALAASVRGNRAQRKAVVRAGSKRAVPYAGAINYGWAERNIEPAQYMQRGDRVMQPRAVHLLEEEIDQLIHRLGLGR
ncbi:hypothetical protein [Nocardioides sp. GXZ039]